MNAINATGLVNSIPDEIGLLLELRHIDFEGNSLNGAIPVSLGCLTHLKTAFLFGNQILSPTLSESSLKCVSRDEVLSLLREIGGDAVSKDRATLTKLFAAWGGATWTKRAGWCSSEPIGSWFGVTTSNEGRVTHLYLGHNELTGSADGGGLLGDLTKLQKLSLYGNRFHGSLGSSFAKLASLNYLDLEESGVSLPPDTMLECRGADDLRVLYRAAGIEDLYISEQARLRQKVLGLK